jgi:hypothetical protein
MYVEGFNARFPFCIWDNRARCNFTNRKTAGRNLKEDQTYGRKILTLKILMEKVLESTDAITRNIKYIRLHFSLNTEPINFPSVGLEMIKYGGKEPFFLDKTERGF